MAGSPIRWGRCSHGVGPMDENQGDFPADSSTTTDGRQARHRDGFITHPLDLARGDSVPPPGASATDLTASKVLLRLQNLAGERNADLAGLAVGGVLAADFVGVKLSATIEVLPGLVEVDARDGFSRGRAHVLGDVVELDGLLGHLRRLIMVAAALKAERPRRPWPTPRGFVPVALARPREAFVFVTEPSMLHAIAQ